MCENVVLLGRCAECDLLIADESVSRYHAMVRPSERGDELIDLGSTNGTTLNDKQIQACTLRHGDRIRLGSSSEVIFYRTGRATGGECNDALEAPAQEQGREQPISGEVRRILLRELHESFLLRALMEHELRLAREIQRALIPERLPAVSGYHIAAYYESARKVGGDFYDSTKVPSGDSVVFLGDVAGKGVAASLLGSMALGCLDTCLRHGSGLESALCALNSILCEKESDRFVTLFLLQLGGEGQCCYSSAGHNTAFVYRADTDMIDELPSTGMVAGALPDQVFRSERLNLTGGDVMLVYSDGLTDAENAEGAMLGEEELLRVVREHARGGAESLAAALLERLRAFTGGERQSDDVTFIAVEKV